jgi:hypothetical protein
VANRLLPSWGTQQLALAIEANALGEPICTLEQYGKIFEALVQESQQSKYTIFATLGDHSSSPSGFCCPCKENHMERHPWAPLDCSILELAITGSSAKRPDPCPTDEQLKAIRERLSTKGYDRLQAQLEKKGWIKSRGAQFLGSMTC